ncbi:cation diffusion facilitator family transporter [Pseudoalteromonas sp. YIC-827]|uniref:Cation diffusion facilitator family transporter n=1 Tax=Pseudoalteromonas qingdaonensis TaxID=3131913 RepID=A0ABU9MY78_9GAMM
MTDITTHQASRKRLLIALSITCSFMVIQLVAAYFANSLAVFADAGHLFVHNSTLFIAILASSIAIHLARNFNDGFNKAELVGGLINGSLYLAISLTILTLGTDRFVDMHHGHERGEVNPQIMALVSILGFVFHGSAAWVLYKGRKESINVYAVFLHTFFDLLSTVTTLLASVIIVFTGWQQVDVLFSMLIAVFVLVTGLRLIYQCLQRLRGAAPALPKAARVEKALAQLDHVASVHNVTVSMVDNAPAVGAHIVLKHHCTLAAHDAKCRAAAERMLQSKFSIGHSVLQIEASAIDGNHQPCGVSGAN